MQATILVLLALVAYGYLLGRRRAVRSVDGRIAELHSVPHHYGAYVALWCGLPAVLLIGAWTVLEPWAVRSLVLAGLPEGRLDAMPPAERNLVWSTIRNTAAGVGFGSDDPAILAAADRLDRIRRLVDGAGAVAALAVAMLGLGVARRRIVPRLPARVAVERVITAAMILASTIAIFTTLGIVVSLVFESLRFFARYPLGEFLFGLHWSPQSAMREDQVAGSGAFGAVPIFAGTFLISAIALAVAAPLGLMTAIALAEYAPRKVRSVAKPVVELLAGIPTVVYGFFAILTVAPMVRDAGAALGIDASANSALAAGLVMGIMIIPFVSSLADDVISAVPASLRDAAYALGSTPSEAIRHVVLPAALPGIVGAILLAVSRAIGETMIVVMAAGMTAELTGNPFAAVTTVTVQIVASLTGDTEFDSAKTLSAFALGLVLFFMTLALNVVALAIVRRYRESYD
ncbi:MAG: phosphate ABC transporter permease subunit PstC [Azospirillaceae bacterium]